MIRNAWNYIEKNDLEWLGNFWIGEKKTEARIIRNSTPWKKIIEMKHPDYNGLIEVYEMEVKNWN